MAAADKGHIDAVNILLSLDGIDINAQDKVSICSRGYKIFSYFKFMKSLVDGNDSAHASFAVKVC